MASYYKSFLCNVKVQLQAPVTTFLKNDFYLVKTGPEMGINDESVRSLIHSNIGATITNGVIPVPSGKKCRIFDITGRLIQPSNVLPGIYYFEVDGKIISKIIKVK